MEFFISTKLNNSPEAIGDDEFKIIPTENYLEVNMQIEDTEMFFVFYLIQKSENSLLVLSCWDDTFDEIIENLDDENYLEILTDTWPILTSLLVNGVKDKYSEGALIKLEDLDNGDHKWFLASIAGNINFESFDNLFCDRTISTITTVKEKSIILLNELQTKKPNSIKHIGKGLFKGALLGLLAAFSE